MIHYLRDKKNNSIVDVESMKSDIRSLVCIIPYSKFLLSLPIDQQNDFINDMDQVQEIRGMYHENGLESQIPHTSYLVKPLLTALAKKWELAYIED